MKIETFLTYGMLRGTVVSIEEFREGNVELALTLAPGTLLARLRAALLQKPATHQAFVARRELTIPLRLRPRMGLDHTRQEGSSPRCPC